MTRIISLLNLILIFTSFSQVYTGIYRSAENPYYWKNKKPTKSYWQQDVHYKLDATLDDSLDVLKGEMTLTYYNNSPDTLYELFFHVNENAFTPGSYYHNVYTNNKNKAKFGKNAAQGLGTTVANIQINNTNVSPIHDNTIFKLKLPQALAPNDSLVVRMDFATYFDIDAGMRRRLKNFKTINNLKHFDAVHWYPQVCVYDAKFGWTTDQHLDKEFYNNFGTFEVDLHLPQHYILDATGVLQNETEVYPDSLKQKLRLSNFFSRKTTDTITRPIPYAKNLKTWRFRAVNVHNFAFTADPLYRIDETEWNGIKAIALVQEQNAPRWKYAVQFAMNVIKVYSTDFGMYAWPKIIIADAKDGMEYPMLTLDDKTYPQNQQLLAHEIGHMWFYGMVGSNETYRASLDEGFTQFLTVWAMNKLTGAVRDRISPNKTLAKRLKKYETKYDRLYNSYIASVHKGFDEQLNTHSCAFNGAVRHGGNYGLVYFKTGVMLDNLRYVLGDSLFLLAMKNYVAEWKMCHPYPEDFRNSIIHFTKNDLNWFFDQWLETTKTLDYKVHKPKLVVSKNDTLSYMIKLSRKGRMQSPVNLTVTDVKGKRYNYYIPNTWFEKPTKDSVLKKWYGWDLLQPTYTATVTLPNKIKSVIIDTSNTLGDIDLRNNHWHRHNPVRLNLYAPNAPSWDKTDKLIRPDLWYNHYDGLQVGFDFQKKYFMDLTNYNLQVYANTGLGQGAIPQEHKKHFNKIAYNFSSRSNINKVLRYSYLNVQSMFNGGVIRNLVGIDKYLKKQDDQNPRFTIIGFTITELYRPRTADLLYFDQFNRLPVQRFNNFLTLFADRRYVLRKKPASFRVELRTPFVLSQFNYNFLQAQHLYSTTWKKFEIRTRVFTRLAHSYSRNIPVESALQVNGASIEEMYTNKYYRAQGVFPAEWQTPHNNVISQQGGGLNIRGMNLLGTNYKAQSGFAGNLEIDFDQFIKLKAKKLTRNFSFDFYGFADGGVFNNGNFNTNNTKYYWTYNAGLGTVIKFNFGSFDIRPFHVRIDWPALLKTSLPNTTQAKLIVGVGRCF